MTKMEIIIIACGCLIPMVSLVMIFPKLLKRKVKAKKSEPPATQEVQRPAPEKVEPIKKEHNESRPIERKAYSKQDLENYINYKKSRMSHPNMKAPPEFHDLPPIAPVQETVGNSIIEEFNSLSPELKALILSGALDKKDF